jgi:hypothetical protein
MNGFRSCVSRVSIGGRVVYDAFARSQPQRPDSRAVIADLMRDGEIASWTQARNVTLTFNGKSWTLPPGGGTLTVTTDGKHVALTPRRTGKTTRAKAWADEMRRRGYNVIEHKPSGK